MPQQVTAAMLYDFVQCPHRVTMDLFGNPADRDPVSPFVQLLWERGSAYEREVIEGLQIPFTNLSILSGDAKRTATLEAMQRGDVLIYGGRISAGNLLGDPDLLRKEGNAYKAGDIKSGAGLEGENEDRDGKPKKHYAVQLGLYTDILERMGVSAGRAAFVWDVHGDEVPYDLMTAQGVRKRDTLWDAYTEVLHEVQGITKKTSITLPALSAICKLCHWRTVCKKQTEAANDLTLIPQLGRAKRDAMISAIPTVTDLAKANLSPWVNGNKTVFPGIGADTLAKFQARAMLLVDPNAKPYIAQPITFPSADTELFFDIETDPMRDLCYLHGFVERRHGDNQTERYHAFIANSPTHAEEERAFRESWKYVKACQPCTIYYYSKYERTWWRMLVKRYPNVASEQEIEAMFDPDLAIDLYYDVVFGRIEWPTYNYSIKTLASYLGFKWRDKEPSGAASIEWYHRWVESGDPTIRQRILDYNEDDCAAMRVLLDGIQTLT